MHDQPTCPHCDYGHELPDEQLPVRQNVEVTCKNCRRPFLVMRVNAYASTAMDAPKPRKR